LGTQYSEEMEESESGSVTNYNGSGSKRPKKRIREDPESWLKYKIFETG
jgi:hypothetical protein